MRSGTPRHASGLGGGAGVGTAVGAAGGGTVPPPPQLAAKPTTATRSRRRNERPRGRGSRAIGEPADIRLGHAPVRHPRRRGSGCPDGAASSARGKCRTSRLANSVTFGKGHLFCTQLAVSTATGNCTFLAKNCTPPAGAHRAERTFSRWTSTGRFGQDAGSGASAVTGVLRCRSRFAPISPCCQGVDSGNSDGLPSRLRARREGDFRGIRPQRCFQGRIPSNLPLFGAEMWSKTACPGVSQGNSAN